MNGRVLLHCIPSLGGGGAERQLALLIPALQAMGWNNHVAYARAGVNLEAIVNAGVPVTQVGPGAVGSIRTLLQVYRLVGRTRPQIVQTWLPHMDIVGGLAAKAHRARWVITERSSSAAYDGSLAYRLREWLARGADCVVANSHAGARLWEELAPDLRRITIPNAVPYDRIRTRTNSARLQSPNPGLARKKILTAGRIAVEKDPLTLLRAIAEVLQARDDSIVEIFGEGELETQLRGQVASLPSNVAGRVRISGYTDDLWGEMASADVFVSMSRFEGNPNVVLEAAACECPLILSDIPAHREIVDATSAWFVPIQDAQALARTLMHVLDNPRQAREKAGAAMELVAQRSVERMARTYDALYRTLLEEHR